MLIQFSKFNNFLWECWFLCKNISNFIPLVWKLHNRYCHIVRCKVCVTLFVDAWLESSFFRNDFAPKRLECGIIKIPSHKSHFRSIITWNFGDNLTINNREPDYLPIHLYLVFEKSSLKKQIRQNGFLACKNLFRNWFLKATQAVKIQFKIV